MGKDCSVPKPKRVFSIQFHNGRGYAIVDPDGQTVGGYASNQSFLLDRLERLQAERDGKTKRGPRACLCCGITFQSEGNHNRLCNPCRARDAGDAPVTPYITRQRRTA